MIQSAVLQLGMLMIPWPLVFLLLGLIVVFAMGKFFSVVIHGMHRLGQVIRMHYGMRCGLVL